MLFTFHYYHSVAPFPMDEDVEEQLAGAEEKAEVEVQLVPMLLIGWNNVVAPSEPLGFQFTEPELSTRSRLFFPLGLIIIFDRTINQQKLQTHACRKHCLPPGLRLLFGLHPEKQYQGWYDIFRTGHVIH